MIGGEGQAVVPFPGFSPVLNSDELKEEVVGRGAEGQLWPVGLSPEAGPQRTKKEAACSAPLPGVNRWVLETQRSQAWIPAWTQIIITRGERTRLTWRKEHRVLQP